MASDLLREIANEIEGRLAEVRPLVLEYERLHAALETLETVDATNQPAVSEAKARTRAKQVRGGSRGSAKGAIERAASSSKKTPRTAGRKPRGQLSAGGRAILDALEHGSHTISELVMVTAIGARDIRSGIRRLMTDGAIVKVDRDGKAAYARVGASSA